MDKKADLSIEEKVNYLKIALNIQGIGVNEETTERIVATYEKIQEVGGDFNIHDSVDIQLRLDKKYAKASVEARQNKNGSIKTYKEWESKKVGLNDYLSYPCQIDEELYLYLAEITPPNYIDNGMVQTGEATREIDGVLHYETASCINGLYYYLGVLPNLDKE